MSALSQPTSINDAAGGYDRALVTPGIVHFGTGRRFRTAIAPLVDRILGQGHLEWGIIAVSQTNGPVHDALAAGDASYVLAEAHGRIFTRLRIRCIHRLLHAHRDGAAIIAAIADPRVQLITVSIGKAGYRTDANGRLNRSDPLVARELAGQELPVTPVGQIVAGLAARYAAGAGPVTIFACDNLDRNNLMLASLVDEMAAAHDVPLADWIAAKVRFPAVIGDRMLLDQPSDSLAESIADVAAERYAHWLFEDNLGAEQRALADVGANFVQDVQPFLNARRRLLDGSLLLLAYVGMLRGHRQLDEAVRDPAIAGLLDGYMEETVAALPPLKGFDPTAYCDELKQRFTNPALTLSLARLARNGSVKLPKTVVPNIIDGFHHGQRGEMASAIIAAWMLHTTSGTLDDSRGPAITEIAAGAGDDWEHLVHSLCAFDPLFGALGRKPLFCDGIVQSVRLLPGLNHFPEN